MDAARFQIRLLGRMRVVRDGHEQTLPSSRKVRVLLAYLALGARPVSRARLCDLFWDVPDDPRGELRWCLSKLRSVLDEATRPRVVTDAKGCVELDLAGVAVDALALAERVERGLADASDAELGDLLADGGGDLLEDTTVDGAELSAWLVAERQRLRAMQVAVSAELALRAEKGTDEALRRASEWLQRAPFEARAHEAMLASLLAAGRAADAEEHVGTAIRAFEREGLDWAPLRESWRSMRTARVSVVAAPPEPGAEPSRRGSVLVMPFTDEAGTTSATTNGVTEDVITRLAKLRVLLVIARGTSYALHERGVEGPEAGRVANVAYVVTGRVRARGASVALQVELAETRGGTIVWADAIDCTGEETMGLSDWVVDRVVASVAEQIERAESHRAATKTPGSLDAWEAYHRGLWHMYRFRAPDNAAATTFFEQALALDPTFARAHAGVSFTHFQNVFLGLTPDRDRQLALALESAGRSVASDDRDPAAHLALGRALWLRGEQDEALEELRRSVALSPNFALGHYTLGFVHAQSGDPLVAIAETDRSRELSPFDPLQFGMLGSRAMAHMRSGEHEEAAVWALRAASRPNAHAHILGVAVATLALAGRRDQARAVLARLRAARPGYDVGAFLGAFRFDRDAEVLVRKAAALAGF